MNFHTTGLKSLACLRVPMFDDASEGDIHLRDIMMEKLGIAFYQDDS